MRTLAGALGEGAGCAAGADAVAGAAAVAAGGAGSACAVPLVSSFGPVGVVAFARLHTDADETANEGVSFEETLGILFLEGE